MASPRFSETRPAQEVIEVVNYYLNEMTEAILAAGGTLDRPTWATGSWRCSGHRSSRTDHADRALAAAREMIGPRLDSFNAWLTDEGHDHTFAMGVGLNSGPVMAGNVGSEQRVEYTAIGDTTNTASRLEGMTKGQRHMLFVADSTSEPSAAPAREMVLVGEFEVRGREEPVPVWTISEEAAAGEDDARQADGVEPVGRRDDAARADDAGADLAGVDDDEADLGHSAQPAESG